MHEEEADCSAWEAVNDNFLKRLTDMSSPPESPL